jgi:hypothetical protein
VFEVLTSVTTKGTVFRVLTPGSSKTFRRFGGTYHLTLQSQGVSQVRNPLNLPPASASFLSGLFFDSEDGVDEFPRNIGLFHNHTALQPRGPQSSFILDFPG